MKGSHLIHRKLLDHWLWEDKPFAYGQAWIELILLTHHTPLPKMIDGKRRIIEKGQLFTRYGLLAERWGWTVNKVRYFCVKLVQDGMIHTQKTTHGIILTLSNYDIYRKLVVEDLLKKSRTNHTQTTQFNNMNELKELKYTIEDLKVIVEKYYTLKDYGDNREYCNLHYGRNIKAATNLMKLGRGELPIVLSKVEDAKHHYTVKKLDWTLETVAKGWPDIKGKPERRYV